MLRNAALVLLAVCSGHFKETITKTRERSGTDIFSFVRGGQFSLFNRSPCTDLSLFPVALQREPVMIIPCKFLWNN